MRVPMHYFRLPVWRPIIREIMFYYLSIFRDGLLLKLSLLVVILRFNVVHGFLNLPVKPLASK